LGGYLPYGRQSGIKLYYIEDESQIAPQQVPEQRNFWNISVIDGLS